MTRINANRKESLLDFAKLWECDTSSCRFGSNKHGKRCEGAPNSKSPEIAGRNPIMIASIGVIRGQRIFAKRDDFGL